MTATYKTVKIFKEQVLGIGSYGKVCKAKCDDQPCAAKILHETLFDPNSFRVLNEEEKRPIRKFEQECEFLRQLRHPNIVQCLGIYEDPSTGLPALLMELMDENLTTFLKKATQPIHYDIQVNLCHDVSLALSYLHSNGIIHSDLSGNNILLIGSVRAKVADFGMAKLSDLNPQDSWITTSSYPGIDVYMPPECLKKNPKYNEKVDCFSFGVIIIQILTRKEPDPGEEIQISVPSFPSGFIMTPATEVERRHDHISEINEKHPLRSLALICLENEPTERPSAQQLCDKLAKLKQCKEYRESMLLKGQMEQEYVAIREYEVSVNERDEKIKALEDLIKRKDHKIEQMEQTLKSQLELILQQRQQIKEFGNRAGEKDQLIVKMEREVSQLRRELWKHLRMESRQHQEEALKKQPHQWHRQEQLTELLECQENLLKCTRETCLFRSCVPSISTYYHCANNISNVPFIGEVEVLECDSLGCEYWNPDHNITIRIPPGTIPPDMTVQIEVAVTLYGPFQFPNSSFPISPILWLCSQKEITFKQPIEIILPHFVNDTAMNFGIKFAKADHRWYSIDKSGMKCYVFEPVDTAFANVKEESRNYGLLSISHCCFFCITADSSFRSDIALGAGYCFWCIEKPLLPPQTRDKVLLCTTFFLSTCSTALKLQYPTSEGYCIHEPIAFQFQKPEDGSEPYILVSIQDERCVVAANPPSRTITASQVYFWNQSVENLERMHTERIYPPKITLALELTESCSTKPVPIQIRVSGAQNELDKEVLLPLHGNTSVQQISPTASIGKWLSTGPRPELKHLLIELRSEVAHEWEDLGIMLDIEPGTLEAIKTTESNKAQSCLREMLKLWQKRINPPPSWSAVVTALEFMKYQGLANDLKQKYNC